MEKRKVIFDCDIGCDDAVALIALLLSEKVDILSITCVKGNVSAIEAADNALKVLKLCDKDIPVYKGCDTPMVRDMLKGRDYNTLMQRIRMEVNGELITIHERSFKLPKSAKLPEKKHAVSYLLETLNDTKEKIDICAIGPLTNLGMAIRLDPLIIRNIGTIYIMGGGLYIGNRTPVAEANFYDDPEAAEIVINSGANVLICPIEPCEMAAAYSRADIDEIKKTNNRIADFLDQQLRDYIDRCNFLFNTNSDSCCIYDYAAISPLIDESIIKEKRKEIVHVDFSGGMADGQMVVDRRKKADESHPVEVIYKMNAKKLHKILLDELKKVKELEI